MPVTQMSGMSARNGHFGNPPPTGGISPQSQMVPSTESCWNTCTSPCGLCVATSVPAVNVGAIASDVDATVAPDTCGSIAVVGATEVDCDVLAGATAGSCKEARSRSC